MLDAKSAGFIFSFDGPFYNVRTKAGTMHYWRIVLLDARVWHAK